MGGVGEGRRRGRDREIEEIGFSDQHFQTYVTSTTSLTSDLRLDLDSLQQYQIFKPLSPKWECIFSFCNFSFLYPSLLHFFLF